MTNTCVLTGKGMVVNLVFSTLIKYFPDAIWRTPKLKWWQTQTRHELRLQNLSYAQIAELENRLNTPGFVPIKLEIF